jgi:amino acid permease
MNANRNTARIVGVLYIVATAAPSLTFFFLGFLGGGLFGEPVPDYLASVSANESQVLGGMFIELVWALAVLGIPVMLFPILRKHNEALALGFHGLRFIEALSVVAGSIILLTLLTLSQVSAEAGVPDAPYYQTLGTLLLAAREWAFMIGSGLVFSLAALVLNYILYQSRLIPRWLSGWGLVGAALSLATYLLQFLSINLDILFLLIALQEMVFAVWLIAKGFNPSAIASLSTKKE